jgi:hypothetical protein
MTGTVLMFRFNGTIKFWSLCEGMKNQKWSTHCQQKSYIDDRARRWLIAGLSVHHFFITLMGKFVTPQVRPKTLKLVRFEVQRS